MTLRRKYYRLKVKTVCFAALVFAVLLAAAGFGAVGYTRPSPGSSGRGYIKHYSANAAYAENTVEFAGGDGSAESPFLIETARQLDGLRLFLGDDHSGKSFKLSADIDLTQYLSESGAGFNGGRGWEPVGGYSFGDGQANAFNGNLNGAGFTVRGLWIDRPDEEFVGLFGYLEDANIKNLNLVLDAKGITGGENAGAAAGYASASENGKGIIERCSATGRVSSRRFAGGFLGDCLGYIISESQFFGAVEVCESEYGGFFGAGGIAGRANEGRFENCFTRLDLSFESEGENIYAGGLCGMFVGVNYSLACYTEQTNAGAFPFFGNPQPTFGGFKPSAVIENCYYSGGFDDIPYQQEGRCRRLGEQEIRTKGAFAGFDFDNVWGFDNNGNLVLRAFGTAYDPPPPPIPPNLTWLYITLGCVLFAGAALSGGVILYRRKKAVVVTETVTNTVEVEVPLIKRPLPNDLSEREREVAELILKGMSRSEIAAALKITEGTVASYSDRIYVKAGADNQKQFIARYTGDAG